MVKREKTKQNDQGDRSDRLIFTMPDEMARHFDLYSKYTHIHRSELGRMAVALFLEKNHATLQAAIEAAKKAKD